MGGGGEVGPEVEEGLGLGGGAVEDGEGVAGTDEVGAHGLAHDARADPAHARVRWAYSGLRRGHEVPDDGSVEKAV